MKTELAVLKEHNDILLKLTQSAHNTDSSIAEIIKMLAVMQERIERLERLNIRVVK